MDESQYEVQAAREGPLCRAPRSVARPPDRVDAAVGLVSALSRSIALLLEDAEREVRFAAQASGVLPPAPGGHERYRSRVKRPRRAGFRPR